MKGWAPLGEVKKINGVSCKRFCGTNSSHGSSEDIVMSLIFLPKLLKHTSEPLRKYVGYFHLLAYDNPWLRRFSISKSSRKEFAKNGGLLISRLGSGVGDGALS